MTNDQETPQTPNVDPIVAELVGDGKKFKTVADLARSKKESDDFIEQLKSENASLREAMRTSDDSSNTVDEVKRMLAEMRGEQNEQPPVDRPTENQSVPGLTEQDVISLLEQVEQKKAFAKNVNNVESQLMKTYADKMDNVKQERLSELGMTEEAFRNLAATAPEAALQLFQQSKVNRPRYESTVNTAANSTGTVRNNQYYQELRKTMKEHEFFEPKLQQQLIADRKALGDDWYS